MVLTYPLVAEPRPFPLAAFLILVGMFVVSALMTYMLNGIGPSSWYNNNRGPVGSVT